MTEQSYVNLRDMQLQIGPLPADQLQTNQLPANSAISAPPAEGLPEQHQFAQKHFIEEVGILFEMVGMPRMAGRIFGWLLISNPPHQSPGEMAEVLQASKGSISTMTRLLAQIGLIERISLPGQRRDYFRIKLNAWSELTKQRLTQITAFRQLAERGLSLLRPDEPHLSQRLEEMRDIHAFLEQEMPLVIDRWQQQRSAAITRSTEQLGDGNAPESSLG